MVGKTNAILTIDRNNYGDGSLNTVSDGYKGHIAVNGNADIYKASNGYGNYRKLANATTSTTAFNQIGLWSFFEAELYASYGATMPWIAAVQGASPIKDKVTVLNQLAS